MLLDFLEASGRHGRLWLVAGLIAGLTLPSVAAILRPWLPELVALLLFLSALRIGARAAVGRLEDTRRTVLTLAVYQVAMPLIALAVFAAFGVAETPLALAIVLMLSAPSVTGAPNFTALMGHDPAPAMRLLILGTALFPLTLLPVLWLAPGLGGIGVVILAALRLILVIAVAVALGFAVRAVAVPTPSDRQRRSLDGLGAIVLAIVVIGLMSALGPALKETPAIVLGWLGAAVAVNFGLQALAFGLIREPGVAIVAGNRNIALFLVALPAGISDPILIFIGCYQIPMYLTPLVMRRLYGVGDL